MAGQVLEQCHRPHCAPGRQGAHSSPGSTSGLCVRWAQSPATEPCSASRGQEKDMGLSLLERPLEERGAPFPIKLLFHPCYTCSREVLFFPSFLYFQEEAHYTVDTTVQHDCLRQKLSNCWKNWRKKYETVAVHPGREFEDGGAADPSRQL